MTNPGGKEMEPLDKLQKGTECTELEDVSSFQQTLLFAIASLKDPSGQEIKEYIRGRYTDREAKHGRLYPNLDTLAELGLVERGQRNRRTNEYTITTEGIEYLRLLADVSTTAHKAAIHKYNADSE